jgi:hypothetical protein
MEPDGLILTVIANIQILGYYIGSEIHLLALLP